MTNPDPLLMTADIARVAGERPELDGELVAALYQHLVLIEARQPTVDELRAYVDRVSCLDQDTLRQRLGLGPRRTPGRRPRTEGRRAHAPAGPARGRPRGSGHLTAATVTASYQRFRSEHSRRPTQEELASSLDVAVRSLQRFLRHHDMGWPLAE
jgi:hypothetical protein